MKYQTILLILLILQISCQQEKVNNKTENDSQQEIESNIDSVIQTDEPVDSSLIDSVTLGISDDQEENIEDCVFNNDYKGLTAGWLKELNIQDYEWDSNRNNAIIIDGRDSILVTQGGCYHFGFTVTQKLMNENVSFDSLSYWIDKSILLAEKFEFDNYLKSLKDSTFTIENEELHSIWISVEDDNIDDNLFYSGIELKREDNNSKITISQYYN